MAEFGDSLQIVRYEQDRGPASDYFSHVLHTLLLENVVTYAENFVTVVGQGYLDLTFEFGGGERPFFETDATRISRALERLGRQVAATPGPDAA